MKEYRNLIDLYYRNIKNIKSNEPFLYNSNFSLSYDETEKITNSLARNFLNHSNKNNHITVIFSNDNIIKAVCSIALIKANSFYVFLDACDLHKINKIQENFHIGSIVCDSTFEVPADFLDKDIFILKLSYNDLKAPRFSTTKPLKKRLTAAQRENLPFRIQFTSGSTGEPKLNILQQFDIADAINTFQIEFIEKMGISKFGQYLSLNYAYGIDSLFSAIFNGLPTYFFSEHEKKDIIGLFETIENNNIDIVFFPASLINIIAKTQSLIERFPKSLKSFFAGGERIHLTTAFVNELIQKNIRFAVSYGCSEMHLLLYYIVNNNLYDVVLSEPVLGTPCLNCKTVVLDDSNNIVSQVGDEGTLYICRKGKGYNELHLLRGQNPKYVLLSDKNVYFNTCDRVKISESGYVHCGRQEHRIKVRGYWIELDSLRKTILDIPKITSAQLISYFDDFDNCRLALLYTGVASEESIVDYLSQRVQNHEIPSIFIQMESLPLTATDKTDIKQCEKIVSNYIEKYSKAQNSLEALDSPKDKIKSIFSQYSIDVCENPDKCFDLVGIDSLTLLVIICDIEKELGVRLDIEAMSFDENNTLNKFIDMVLCYLN